LLAGCTSGENTTSTLSPEPTATSSPTPEPVGPGDNPAELIIVNRIETTQSISVGVNKRGGSSVFSETFELDSGERIRRDIFDYETQGTYLVTGRLSDGTEQSYEWNLREEPAGG